MDINEIYQNIDEFLEETPQEEIEEMMQYAMEKFPEGITLEEYLLDFDSNFPY